MSLYSIECIRFPLVWRCNNNNFTENGSASTKFIRLLWCIALFTTIMIRLDDRYNSSSLTATGFFLGGLCGSLPLIQVISQLEHHIAQKFK